MSFWNAFNSTSASNVNWKQLDRLEQIDEIIDLSHQKPVAIFKHSVRCGISAMVLHQLESEWDIDTDQLEVYFLDLIKYRPVSNAVAERLGVPHQSPQIIVLKDGQVIHHSSHHAISLNRIKADMGA